MSKFLLLQNMAWLRTSVIADVKWCPFPSRVTSSCSLYCCCPYNNSQTWSHAIVHRKKMLWLLWQKNIKMPWIGTWNWSPVLSHQKKPALWTLWLWFSGIQIDGVINLCLIPLVSGTFWEGLKKLTQTNNFGVELWMVGLYSCLSWTLRVPHP